MAKENSGHKNLIPAKEGEVRNPKGRGKGVQNNSTILRNVLLATMTPKEKKDAGKHFDPKIWMFNKLKDAAESEKPSEVISAIKEMWDRAEGKAVAKIEQTIKDDTVTEITFEEISDSSQVRPKDED